MYRRSLVNNLFAFNKQMNYSKQFVSLYNKYLLKEIEHNNEYEKVIIDKTKYLLNIKTNDVHCRYTNEKIGIHFNGKVLPIKDKDVKEPSQNIGANKHERKDSNELLKKTTTRVKPNKVNIINSAVIKTALVYVVAYILAAIGLISIALPLLSMGPLGWIILFFILT